VAVKAGGRGGALIPQEQYFLVDVSITDPDNAIVPGSMGQVKVHCKNETCAHWLWRTISPFLFGANLK
jgi:hypothetical protein